MKKLFKKFMGMFVILVLVGSFSCQLVRAQLIPVPDTSFSFWFDYTSTTVEDYSEPQLKTDSSRAGVTHGESAYSFTGSIIGMTDTGVYREYIQVSKVRVNPKITVTISNWVYQNDIPYAVLKGEADYDAIYECNGTWLANGY